MKETKTESFLKLLCVHNELLYFLECRIDVEYVEKVYFHLECEDYRVEVLPMVLLNIILKYPTKVIKLI